MSEQESESSKQLSEDKTIPTIDEFLAGHEKFMIELNKLVPNLDYDLAEQSQMGNHLRWYDEALRRRYFLKSTKENSSNEESLVNLQNSETAPSSSREICLLGTDLMTAWLAQANEIAEHNSKSHAEERALWPPKIGNDLGKIEQKVVEYLNSSIMLVETSKPNSKLCILCSLVFETFSELRDISITETKKRSSRTWVRTPYYAAFSELECSAGHGCHLCTLFISIFRRNMKEQCEIFGSEKFATRIPEARLDLVGYLEFSDFNIIGEDEGIRLRLGQSFHLSPSILLNVAPVESRKSISQATPPSARSSLDTIDSSINTVPIPSLLDLPRKWYEDCLKNHESCHPKGGRAPTRLLKIDDDILRICTSAAEGNCSTYATLSHCWGLLEFVRLLKSNIAQFHKEISRDSLTKSFSDAIEIARALGLSWIWIDSLCIIQDDPEDWQKESAMMSTVYSLSSLNICATAAKDGTVGCLFERDLVYALGLEVEGETDGIKQCYFLADYYFTSEMSNNPLGKRAWTLQERVLPKRTLHCAESQLFWQCQTRSACQTFPDKLPERLPSLDLPSVVEELGQYWDTILGKYSAMNLTKRSDALIAISGIARQVYEQTGDRYFAGIFERDLVRNLCWGRGESSKQIYKQKNRQLPSWSWANHVGDGSVGIDFTKQNPTKASGKPLVLLVKIEDVWTDLKSDDPFGDVKGGVLSLKSRFLLPCNFPPPNFRGEWRTIDLYGSRLEEVSVSWDWDEDRHQIFLLWMYHSNFSAKGLLLKQTGSENGQYRRVGRLGHFYSIKVSSQDFNNILLKEGKDREDCEQFFEDLDDMIRSEQLPEKSYQSKETDEKGVKWYTVTIV